MVPARSNDMVVGFPLDIARYAIILSVVAKAVGMEARYVYMPSANSHIYANCFDIADDVARGEAKTDPRLIIQPEWDSTHSFPLDNLTLDHFGIAGYDPSPAVKVPVN